MSYQLLKSDVLFYQRFLKSNGFYKGTLDGDWGPKTAKADTDFLNKSNQIATQTGTFDARSESNIITLIPAAQIQARKFLKLAKENNKIVRIISGTRTYDEQNVLYRKGRYGSTEPRVTNAKGGQSNHNFGLAWDIGIFGADGSYKTNDADYKKLANLLMPQFTTVLEWGGDWSGFQDVPHYQLKAVSNSVASIRSLFENGTVYV